MPGGEQIEELSDKTHFWHSLPGLTDTKDLVFVRAVFQPGGGHPFHYHPNKEEVLYFLSGTAEQWVGDERMEMPPGSSVYIPRDTIHATFNRGAEPLEFIAVITPASADGPITIEVADEEPWKSIAK